MRYPRLQAIAYGTHRFRQISGIHASPCCMRMLIQYGTQTHVEKRNAIKRVHETTPQLWMVAQSVFDEEKEAFHITG